MKLIIFGSTGDLVKKKVFPALGEFKELEIINLGRKDISIEQFTKNYCTNCSEELKKRISYRKIDFDKDFCLDCETLISANEQMYFYISLPPKMVYLILSNLVKLKKHGINFNVLIEKPFGFNLQEAQKLNELIKQEKLEKQIYLADHYLFKPEILKLNQLNCKEVEITSLEKEGINKREYYNEVGAIKDMIQSHLMNILFKIIKKEELKEKMDINIKEIKIGQYKGYEEEISQKSNTETYARIKFILNLRKEKINSEIKVIFETGKKMKDKASWIKLDNKKIELISGKNPYISMFKAFFSRERDNFPSIEQSIYSWGIIEEFFKEIKNKHIPLEKY